MQTKIFKMGPYEYEVFYLYRGGDKKPLFIWLNNFYKKHYPVFLDGTESPNQIILDGNTTYEIAADIIYIAKQLIKECKCQIKK